MIFIYILKTPQWNAYLEKYPEVNLAFPSPPETQFLLIPIWNSPANPNNITVNSPNSSTS